MSSNMLLSISKNNSNKAAASLVNGTNHHHGSGNNDAASAILAAIAGHHAASSAGGSCYKQHNLATAAATDSLLLNNRRFSADQPLSTATLLMVQNSLGGMSLMHPSSSTSVLPETLRPSLNGDNDTDSSSAKTIVSNNSTSCLIEGSSGKRYSITAVNNAHSPPAAADLSSSRALLMKFFEESSHASDFLPPPREEHVPPPPRRSKSLKASALRSSTSVSPSSTGEKKMVRFADALGLDLSEVKVFFQQDIPDPLHRGGASGLNGLLMSESDDEDELLLSAKSAATATSAGNDSSTTDAAVSLPPLPPGPTLVALFSSPGVSDPNFIDRVRDNRVCLESISIKDTKVDGFVRVFNLAFTKEVFIRYTFNEWQSTIDKQAQFSESKSDGLTDRFAFTFYAPPYMKRGSCVEFCICYRSGGGEWWDSNYGRNYRLECFDNL